MASSQPPPSAKPFTAAMTGLPSCSIEIEYLLAAAARALGAVRRVARELMDIRSSHERLVAGAGHDDAADRVVVLKIEDCLPELVERRRVERVQTLRAMNRENRDAGLTLDKQVVKGHRASQNDA